MAVLLENHTKSSLIFIYIYKERKKEKDNVVITGQRMTTTTTPLSLLSGRGKCCCGKGPEMAVGVGGQELRRVCRQNASHLSAKCLVFVGKMPRVCWQNASRLSLKCGAIVGQTPQFSPAKPGECCSEVLPSALLS